MLRRIRTTLIRMAAEDPELRAVVVPLTRQAEVWKSMPKGWTNESRQKFWETLTGDNKHKVTECIKRMGDKDGIDDPGAFCAALADRVEGKGWRSKKKADAAGTMSTARLPPVFKRVLAEVRFKKRKVRLRVDNSFTMYSAGDDGNKGFTAVVDMTKGSYTIAKGAWGGGALEGPQSPVDDTKSPSRSLSDHMAIVQGQMGGSPYVSITVTDQGLALLKGSKRARWTSGASTSASAAKLLADLEKLAGVRTAGISDEWRDGYYKFSLELVTQGTMTIFPTRGRSADVYLIPNYRKTIVAIRKMIRSSGIFVKGLWGPSKVYEPRERGSRSPAVGGHEGNKVVVEIMVNDMVQGRRGSPQVVENQGRTRQAFNKYNAPEVMGQLMTLLQDFKLDEPVQMLKRHKIPQAVDKAWRGREKKGSTRLAELRAQRSRTKRAADIRKVLGSLFQGHRPFVKDWSRFLKELVDDVPVWVETWLTNEELESSDIEVDEGYTTWYGKQRDADDWDEAEVEVAELARITYQVEVNLRTWPKTMTQVYRSHVKDPKGFARATATLVNNANAVKMLGKLMKAGLTNYMKHSGYEIVESDDGVLDALNEISDWDVTYGIGDVQPGKTGFKITSKGLTLWAKVRADISVEGIEPPEPDFDPPDDYDGW